MKIIKTQLVGIVVYSYRTTFYKNAPSTFILYYKHDLKRGIYIHTYTRIP